MTSNICLQANFFISSELRHAFRVFDKDDDGTITTQEIGSVLRNLGSFPTEQELQQMLADIDIDGDGTFSFEEFVQLMFNMGNITEISEEQEEQELRDAFKVFDRTGRGYITNVDLRSILHSLGENLTDEESKFVRIFQLLVQLIILSEFKLS